MPSENANSPEHEAALEYLFGRIDYERARSVPYRRREFKLDRMRQLLDRLENPQKDLPIVHVAGTKGKGSTAAMISAVLRAAGYRVGVFSSPHLDRVEERMAVDGEPCSPDELVALIERIKPAVELLDREADESGPDEHGPTYFEINTAAALLHFVRRRVDVAVLEVGLGGRLDSTNVCTPRVSVITSISFDHMRQLGNTLAAIAREKAGIVKPGVPLISGVVEDEPREAIREICQQRGCRIVELGVDFDFDFEPARHLERGPAHARLDFRYRGPRRRQNSSGTVPIFPQGKWDCPPCTLENLPLSLVGRHQAVNAAVALATLAELGHTRWNIPEEAIRAGLKQIECPARVEVLDRHPAVVIDSAHNPASVAALVRVLDESFSVRRRLLIFATTEEKDLSGMLQHVLGRFDRVIFTRYLTNPRSVPPEKLAALAGDLGFPGNAACATPAEAWESARALAGPEDLVCVAGSFFIAAEIRRKISQPGSGSAEAGRQT